MNKKKVNRSVKKKRAHPWGRVRVARIGQAPKFNAYRADRRASEKAVKTTASTTMKIDQIQVGDRFRKDIGNLRPLADSIAEMGLLHPVVATPEGLLIAGWRRIEACRLLGWREIPVTVADLQQVARGEMHENGIRKGLQPSEAVALKRAIESLKRCEAHSRQGFRSDLQHSAILAERQRATQGDARDKIAEFLGMGRTNLKLAEEVVAAGEREPEKYGELVEQMDRRGNVADAHRRLQVLRQAEELNAKPPAFPTGPFQVIEVDPPWRHESGNSLPYPTMSIEDIKALPVVEIADKNAILWLWTTNAHLRIAFEVVEAWGFEYRNILTWVKNNMGTGEWLRGQTEHCILAVRGKPIFLGGKYSTVLAAKRREHSRKPEEFYKLVEATCPGRKVELFSRQQRAGWHVYGNDIGKFGSEKG